jgi:hypothetical protein
VRGNRPAAWRALLFDGHENGLEMRHGQELFIQEQLTRP